MLKRKNKIRTKSILLSFFLLMLMLQLAINFRIATISKTNAAAGTIVAFEETHTPFTCVNATNPYATTAGLYDSFAE